MLVLKQNLGERLQKMWWNRASFKVQLSKPNLSCLKKTCVFIPIIYYY